MLFISRRMRNLLACDDIIELLANAIPMYIKQCKIKGTVSSLTLKKDNGLFYSFPPSLVIETNGVNTELDFWELKPKELHYMIDAISGDTNIQLNGNIDKIDPLFQSLCERLNEFNWQTVCKPSQNFSVKYDIR